MALLTPMRLSLVVCLYGLVTDGAQNPPNPPANPPQAAQLASNVIEGVEIRGARRVPADTMREIVRSKAGDVYNEEAVQREFTALWNTGRFDDIEVKRETGPRGGVIVRFVVTERPL